MKEGRGFRKESPSAFLDLLSGVTFLYLGVSGHFGQVRELRERASGVSWAGKFVKLRRSVSSRLGLERKTVEREVEILQALQHNLVVEL